LINHRGGHATVDAQTEGKKSRQTNSRSVSEGLSDRSIGDHQNTIRKFWRWLRTPPVKVFDS